MQERIRQFQDTQPAGKPMPEASAVSADPVARARRGIALITQRLARQHERMALQAQAIALLSQCPGVQAAMGSPYVMGPGSRPELDASRFHQALAQLEPWTLRKIEAAIDRFDEIAAKVERESEPQARALREAFARKAGPLAPYARARMRARCHERGSGALMSGPR